MSAQHLEALAHANANRLARAVLRARVSKLEPAAGAALVAELVLTPPPELHTASVSAVLGWIRRTSTKGARRYLHAAGIGSELVTIGRLTDRQRRVLAAALTHELDATAAARAYDRPAEALAYLESLPSRTLAA